MPDANDAPSAIPRREALTRLGVAAFGIGLPSAPISLARTSRERHAEADFERILRLASVPSMSIAVVDGDKISTEAVGIRRAGDAERVSPDTVYAAASLTKTVFSYVFLGLVNEGAIALDRPIREYLPLPNPDDPRAPAITARRLLSHSG